MSVPGPLDLPSCEAVAPWLHPTLTTITYTNASGRHIPSKHSPILNLFTVYDILCKQGARLYPL